MIKRIYLDITSNSQVGNIGGKFRIHLYKKYHRYLPGVKNAKKNICRNEPYMLTFSGNVRFISADIVKKS